MSNNNFDVIVIGGGPGGSTAATLLAKKGLKVALFEKEEFPRFKIGESLLPYSMDILKESGVFDKLNSGKYIKKYGASFIDYREEDQVYFEFLNGLDSDHPYAFEVPRDQFDKDLIDHAKECGVEVFQPARVREINLMDDKVDIATEKENFSAKYVVDASGRKALLGSQFKNRQSNRHFINNMAIFSHYKNVKRSPDKKEGDIVVGILPQNAWSWFIPFKGEISSVGIVCQPETYHSSDKSEDFIKEQMQCHPLLKEIMANAERVKDVQVVSNYSYTSREKMGDRWIMVGDAATFLDPVFSSGVHVTLMTAKLSSEIVFNAFQENKKLSETSLGQEYPQKVQLGAERFQALLLLFYNTSFIKQMKNAASKESLFKSFTSAVGGDMWNDDNLLFRMGVLAKDSAFNEKSDSL